MENNGLKDGNFTKEFFLDAWGTNGYEENFSYGVGIDQVCQKALFPFTHVDKNMMEIGCGGGSFTRKMKGRYYQFFGLDVIAKPPQLNELQCFHWIELADQCYSCLGINDDCIDFCYSYNTFCHLSDEAIKSYLADIYRVLSPGGDLVFMLSDFQRVSRLYFPETADMFRRGEILPNGHFYQDEETIQLVIDPMSWDIMSTDMIPAHRDRIVHLRSTKQNV